MNGTRAGMNFTHPPHPINVATLPCESQNTENVILQREITKENWIRYTTGIIASSKCTRVIMFLFVTHQCMYETIYDMSTFCKKRLMQTWFDFNQDIVGATKIN